MPVFLSFFCLFSVLSATHKCRALLTCNRQELLDIANSANHLEFTGFIPLELQHISRSHSHRHHPQEGREAPSSSEVADPRRVLQRGQTKRGGLHDKLKARTSRPPQPSLLLANMRPLENKLDELRARVTSQQEIRECCTLIFTETWLSEKVPESSVQLQTHSIHRGDWTAASGKAKGEGVYVFINNSWCGDIQTVFKHCSPDMEFLLLKCHPYYLPREFTAVFKAAVFIAAVYIHPANSKVVLGKLHEVLSELETAHPDAIFIAAGDFNQ